MARSQFLSKSLEPDPPFLFFSLKSPRIGSEAGDGGAAGMPILIILTLWLLCTLLLFFLLYSFFKALCRVSPANRTTATAAAAAASAAVSAAASINDGAAAVALRDVLSRLPVFAYSSATQKKQLSCSVCLADFKDGERGRFLPRCFHSFHVECVDEWLASHSECPVCRASIDPEAAPPPV